LTASAASCAPWKVAGGSPSRDCESDSAVMPRASACVRPRSSSVKREAQAIDVVQPRQRKRASAIRPSTMRAESLRMSPQTGCLPPPLQWRRTVLRHCADCEVIENSFAEHFRKYRKDGAGTATHHKSRNLTQKRRVCREQEELRNAPAAKIYFFGGKYFFSMEATTT